MKRILVLVDLLEGSDLLIEEAAVLAKALTAKLWLLHVAEPDPDFVGFNAGPDIVRSQMASEFKNEHNKIQELADQLRLQGLPVTALLVQGATSEKIIEQVDKLEIELVIAGLHKHGRIYKAIVGSTTDQLLEQLTSPILLVPE